MQSKSALANLGFPRIAPARYLAPDNLQVGIRMLGKVAVHGLPILIVDQRPHLVLLGKMPGPIPGRTWLRANIRATGMPHQKYFHVISLEVLRIIITGKDPGAMLQRIIQRKMSMKQASSQARFPMQDENGVGMAQPGASASAECREPEPGTDPGVSQVQSTYRVCRGVGGREIRLGGARAERQNYGKLRKRDRSVLRAYVERVTEISAALRPVSVLMALSRLSCQASHSLPGA